MVVHIYFHFLWYQFCNKITNINNISFWWHLQAYSTILTQWHRKVINNVTSWSLEWLSPSVTVYRICGADISEGWAMVNCRIIMAPTPPRDTSGICGQWITICHLHRHGGLIPSQKLWSVTFAQMLIYYTRTSNRL